MLKRAGKLRAVVQHEFTAGRVKVYVPKESCELILSLSAIKAPARGEEFGDEGLAFTKDQIHQRDVEIDIVAQDKRGNFLGNLWLNKALFQVELLERGYAKIFAPKDTEYYNDLQTAEQHAKKMHKNVWKDWDEAAEQAERKQRREARNGEQQKQQKERQTSR